MNIESDESGRAVKKLKTGNSTSAINYLPASTSGLTESSQHSSEKVSPNDKISDKAFDHKRLFLNISDDSPLKIDFSCFSPQKGLKNCFDPEKVVEMVASTLQNDSTKLTRSKAKHINAPFVTNTCSQDAVSECAVLLHQDLGEDSTDEEYNPIHDDSSDNESKVSESPVSPYPPTPTIIPDVSQSSRCSEGNIGQRTRSKLSLSTTAIETIEQQFIPPDITTDMYDTECDNQEWLEFLKEFQNPIHEKPIEHTEDENDPEYNIKNDTIENIDFEELRHDKGVKVTKRELHDLMTEWFGCCSPFSSEEDSVSTPAGNLNNLIQENVPVSAPGETATTSKPKDNVESKEKLKTQNSTVPSVSRIDILKSKAEENNSVNSSPVLRSDRNLTKNNDKLLKEVGKKSLSLPSLEMEKKSPKHQKPVPNDNSPCFSELAWIDRLESSPRNKNIGSECQLSKSKNETNPPMNQEQLCRDAAIQELDDEIERQLEAKAQKNNLSATTVKSIIKAVVTNQDVVEMVSSSLKGTPHEVFLPKITRSKAKEFRIKENCDHLMPEVKTKSSVLLDDLHEEESSDDEYNPRESSFNETDEAGDNSQISGSFCSSLPGSPGSSLESSDGEGVGNRTRSKVDLQGTSLEKIESNFIPPDVTHDMYETACDNTEWIEFLKGIHNDGPNNLDESDSEFNVMNESLDEVDEEELRADKGVKITKKELRVLKDDYRLSYIPSKPRPDDGEIVSKGPKIIQRDAVKNSKNASPPVQPTLIIQVGFCIEQLLVLQQQLQQHVQLLLQGFLLAYKHPLLEESFALDSKDMLYQLNHLRMGSKIYSCANLEPCLQLISDWEKNLSGSKYISLLKFYQKEEIESVQAVRRKLAYFPKLPPILMEACLKSTAFLYPSLLPNYGYRHNPPERNYFSQPESCLIAVALANFFDHMEQIGNKSSLRQACSYICSTLMPSHSLSSVMNHIDSMNRKKSVMDNPIRTYMQTGKAPNIMHYVLQLPVPPKRLLEQPRSLFPPSWRTYFTKRKK